MSQYDDRDRTPRGASASDPAYQGARPAAFADTVEAWSFGEVSDAMSARLAQNWWLILLRGLFAIAFGVIAILLPGVTLAALVLLFAAYMLVDGILAIIAGVRAARRHERWVALVLEGVADLVASAIAWFWPLATILAFVILAGAWAVVSGALLLGAAFRLNIAHGRWLMALGGAASLLWGFLLLIQPALGAVALAWWMGAYALFFGVILIALSIRLRSQRRALPPSGALPQGT